MLRKRQDREAEGLSITDGTPSGAGPGTRERIRGGLKKLLRGKKRKVIALVLVASIAGGVVVWRGHGQTAAAATEYQEAEVERRSITNSLSASGTLEPADSYTVNTLVSGEILSDTFEKGDQVEEGQLLYTIDSSNASTVQVGEHDHSKPLPCRQLFGLDGIGAHGQAALQTGNADAGGAEYQCTGGTLFRSHCFSLHKKA